MLMKFMKPIVAMALVSAMVAGVSQGTANPTAMTGKPLPAFKMTDLAGKTVTNASLKGKVVLFDFWATWCGPCKMASPLMQSLHKKYASKGLVVIGANVLDEEGKAAKYKKEHGYTYRFTTGGDDLLRKGGFRGIPGFIFVDKKGVVRKVQVGFSPEAGVEMENAVKKLLAS
jgi:thiol-disulfide isomerase/thioredoxin